MALSIFLAKLMGIYFIIIALDLILRRNEVEAATKSFASSTGLLVHSGSLSLLCGLAVVLLHPIYQSDWQGLITIIGWLLLLRGVLRVAFPSHVQKTLPHFCTHWYWVILVITAVLGLFLTYCGFVAIPPAL